jgi:hypothetical protein
MLGIFRAIGRGFRAVFRAFGGVFKSEMAKFVAGYESIFTQIILEIAAAELEGDRSKQREAFTKLKKELGNSPKSFKDHWINWGIETVLAKLKDQGKL